MTATTEQLLDLIRKAVDYLDHDEACPRRGDEYWYRKCNCGFRDLMVRVEDALVNHPERPESSTIEDAIDAFQDACHRHAREAVLGADDDKPSAALAAHDAKMALIRLIRGGNHPEWPESSTPHPADLLDARQETIHVEQPAHRTTPIGGDDDGN